jgi:hypothetical protein
LALPAQECQPVRSPRLALQKYDMFLEELERSFCGNIRIQLAMAEVGGHLEEAGDHHPLSVQEEAL